MNVQETVESKSTQLLKTVSVALRLAFLAGVVVGSCLYAIISKLFYIWQS